MNFRSRIRNAEPYLTLIREGESFHVVRDVTNESDERLKEIGFLRLEDGESVLPRALGSVTRRNSDGYDIRLSESSSGYQSSLPMLLVSDYLSDMVLNDSHNPRLSPDEMQRMQKDVEEIMNNGSNIGMDTGRYPNNRNFIIGANISF